MARMTKRGSFGEEGEGSREAGQREEGRILFVKSDHF